MLFNIFSFQVEKWPEQICRFHCRSIDPQLQIIKKKQPQANKSAVLVPLWGCVHGNSHLVITFNSATGFPLPITYCVFYGHSDKFNKSLIKVVIVLFLPEETMYSLSVKQANENNFRSLTFINRSIVKFWDIHRQWHTVLLTGVWNIYKRQTLVNNLHDSPTRLDLCFFIHLHHFMNRCHVVFSHGTSIWQVSIWQVISTTQVFCFNIIHRQYMYHTLYMQTLISIAIISLQRCTGIITYRI